MSRSVDERVVEMQFNNRDFEKNAKESLSTLDKLKQSLNLLGTGDALKNIGDVDDSNLRKLGDDVDATGGKFSALETIAVGALLRIGQQAVDAGEKLIKSITVDQIAAGWDKYAEKTAAVQTIMGATRKEFSDEGEQMEFVNEQLDKLNWFTDETSYNFMDMVNNIGKFTNNGVKLEDAVTAMEGISTWAALSGANVQEAGRAMYNLSQAMGMGYLGLKDWMSIENANMATMEFKETAIEAAIAAGTLTRGIDGVVTVTGTNHEVTAASFREYLKDAWLSNDVLNATLQSYGHVTDVISEAQDAMEDQYETAAELVNAVEAYKQGDLDIAEVARTTGLTAKEVTGYFEELAKEENELGLRGFKAAQETKTFAEVLYYLKDAASSVWMNIFESIFGNYVEAKALWSALVEELYSVVIVPMENLADLAADWKAWGGNAFVFEGIINLWTAIKNIVGAIAEAWDEVFPPATGKRLAEISRGFRDFTAAIQPSEELLTLIGNAARIVFTILKGGITVISSVVRVIAQLIGAMVTWLLNNEKVQRVIGDVAAALEKLYRWIGYTVQLFRSFIDAFKETESFKRLSGYIDRFVTSIKNLGGGILDTIAGALEKFLGLKFGDMFDLKTLVETADKYLGQFLDYMESSENIFVKFSQWVQDTFASLTKGDVNLSSFTDMFAAAKEKIKTVFDEIVQFLTGGSEGLEGLKEKATSLFTSIWEGMKNGLASIDWGMILNVAKVGSIAWIVYNLIQVFNNFRKFTSSLSDIPDAVVGVLKSVKNAVQAYANDLNATALLKVAASIGVLALALIGLSLIPSDKLAIAAVTLGIVSLALIGIMNAIAKIKDSGGDEKAAALEKFSKTFGKAMKRFATLFGIAAIISSVAVAVGILALVIKMLSKMPLAEAAQGMILMGGIATMLVLVVDYLSQITDKISMRSVAALLALSVAIGMLVVPIKLLSGQDAGGLIVMIGAMMSLVLAVNLLSQAGLDSLKGAAALVVLAVSINMLVPSLLIVGAHAETAGLGLLILAGALAALLIGGAIAGELAVGLAALNATMLSFGGTVLMVGAGLALGGAAFLLASIGVEKLAQNLGPLAESMVTFMQTLNENNDVILQFVRNLFDNLAVAFDEFIPQIATLVAKLMIAILQAIADHTEELLGGVLRLLVDVLSFLEEQFVPLTNRIVNLIGLLILDVADAIVNATEVFGNAIKYVTDALILILVEGIEGILTSILGSIPGIGPKAAEAIHNEGLEITSGIRSDMDAIRGEMEAKAKEVGEAIPDTMSAAISDGQPKVQSATKSLSDIPDEPIKVSRSKYKTSGENIPGGLAEGITANSFKVTTATNSLKESMVGDLQAMSSDFNPVGEEWMTSLTEGMNVGMSNMDTGFLTEFQGLMDTKFSAMTPNMNTYGLEWFGEAGILGGATTGMTDVDLATTDFLDSEQLKFEDYIPDFLDVGERSMGTMEGYGAGIQNMLDEVTQAGTEDKDGVITELESGISEATTAGEESALGYASGVRSKIDEAVNAARELAAASWAAAKAEIQVSSPSKKFAWLGEQSDAGFAQGLIESTYLVEDASVGMARSAVNAMGQALAEANSYITDTMDINPTITPVMDLSNIQEGIGSINDMVGSRLVTSGVGLSTTQAPNNRLLTAINGLSQNTGRPNANFSIYINGSNKDVNEIAEEVINRINIEYQRQRAVWA